MRIERAVAFSIHAHLNIVEVYPAVLDMEIDELEDKIDTFVKSLQAELSKAMNEVGMEHIAKKDVEGLCCACLNTGIGLPKDMLLKMCQEIIRISGHTVKYLGDNRWVVSIPIAV